MYRKSATYDEPALLASGTHFLRTFDHRFNAENPPLLKAVYALPTLGLFSGSSEMHSKRVYSYDMQTAIAHGNRVLFSQPRWRAALFGCRLMVVLTACALAAFFYCVARRIWNRRTAGVLLWLFCLSPNILAHARLFTPDLGCTALFFVTVIWWQIALMTRRRRHAALTGLFLGLTLLAKFTAVLLLPILILQTATWLTCTRTWRRRALVTLGVLALVGVIAIAAVNLAYGFKGTFRPLNGTEYRSELVTALQRLPVVRSVPVPFPAGYVRGFDIVAHNNDSGLPNVFLGRLDPQGGPWWYYYAVAFLVKTPGAVLIGLVWWLTVWLRQRRRRTAVVTALAVAPLIVFVNFSFVASRQLGLRYILPMWPFMFLALGGLIHWLLHTTGRWPKRFGLVLAVWYVISVLGIYPHYLAYFNELSGGARNGHRYFAVSNLDWGQDLPALAAWQRAHGDPDMLVLYYGSVPVEAYGVRSVRYGELPMPAFLAVSVTNLFLYDDFPFLQFLRRECTPIARLGHSIWIYDTGSDVLARMTATQQPVPPTHIPAHTDTATNPRE